MSPTEKLKYKLLKPEKLVKIANAISDADGDGRMDRGYTICPFHHSSNGGGINILSVRKGA